MASLAFPLPPCFSSHPVQNSRVPSEPITTTGEVLHIYSERAYQVSLPNGKMVIAHPAKAMFSRKDEIVPGAKVALELTPFDFEKARIADIL